MDSNGEGWHQLIVTRLFALFKTKNKLELHKTYVLIKVFAVLVCFLKNCDIGILEFNKCLQFAKVPSIVHAYLKPLIQKRYQWKLNPEKSSITKIGHSCGYATSMIWTSDAVENKHDVYRGKDCMKKI